jgi:hypothetical protein
MRTMKGEKMTNKEQMLKAGRIGIGYVRVAMGAANRGDWDICREWIYQAKKWAEKLIILMDDPRMTRGEQVLAFKVGQAVLAMIYRQFGSKA